MWRKPSLGLKRLHLLQSIGAVSAAANADGPSHRHGSASNGSGCKARLEWLPNAFRQSANPGNVARIHAIRTVSREARRLISIYRGAIRRERRRENIYSPPPFSQLRVT